MICRFFYYVKHYFVKMSYFMTFLKAADYMYYKKGKMQNE